MYRPIPSEPGTSVTETTPGITPSASRTASGDGPAISTSTRAVGKNCSTSESIGPWATITPWLMMTTEEQTIETSGRMCVDRITVWSPASDLIRSRISVICLGSSPMVGSSRMSTAGSLTIACARPTR